MWFTARMSRNVAAGFASAASELLQATSRRLMIAIGSIYSAWCLVAMVAFPFSIGWNSWLIWMVIALAFALALFMIPRQLLVAQAVWQAGLAVAITLAIATFRQPVIVLFYALLPLMAVVTVGWPAGLLVKGLVIGLLWWLSHSPVMPSIPASYSLAVVIGGVSTGLFGWVAIDTLLTVTQWSLFYSEQARQKLEETRHQQVELKQAQQDLILANQELARLSDRLKVMYLVAEEARRAKEEFVANVSHELRTPLNMIIGFSEMITQTPWVYGNLPPTLLTDIEVIYQNSQHLSRLVDDVLDLSQIEAGRMALSKEWTRLQEIIDAAVIAVRPLFESKKLYLETEVSPDLPPLFCDSTRIRQVLLNLLSNAGRYTERGGVRVKAWREKDDIVVSVADTGPGIAAEDQRRLFEPFQQLDGSIRRAHGGSGLGLSISKRFVEMHGGRIWLESPSTQGGLRTGEGGVGLTCYFSLPLETPLPATLSSADDARRWFSPYAEYEYKVRTRPSRAPAPNVVPRFVLLEKGETLRQLFTRYMDDVESVCVQDVEEAIEELNRSAAQALVVNASLFAEMPTLKGQLTHLPYDTPVVTCWVLGEDEAARQLGVVRYLVKPITREVLLSTLESLGDSMSSVLVVDDQPDALRLFARMLSSTERNYRILRARNGQQALNLLHQQRPDVMLLDLIMPGMNGFQVLQEKSQDPSIREIPVVVISARDPAGEPIVSNMLTVTRGGGLSVRELLTCICTVSEILAPSVQSVGRGQPEKPAA